MKSTFFKNMREGEKIKESLEEKRNGGREGAKEGYITEE